MNGRRPFHIGATPPPTSLHRYITLTAIVTFILLIVGGLVTSTDSGLAVPDWPLSYGTWLPPMVGGIRFEHGHRMLAGLVGVMILALAAWLWKTEPRRWVRMLSYSALGGVIAQALLGGLTVLLLLPPAVSIAHACLGPTVLCLMVCLARSTAPRWSEQPTRYDDVHATGLRFLGVGLAALTAAQLLMGAVIRHTGLGVSLHVSGAIALSLGAVWLGASLIRRRHTLPHLIPHLTRFLALLSLQLLFGMSVFFHRSAILLRTAHQAIGIGLLAQAVVLAWEIARSLTPAATTVTHTRMAPQAAR